jgi:serine carboxypeptidase-like clade 2
MNDKGALEFLWTHGVISDEAWANILATCTFTPADDHHCFNAAHSFTRGTYDRYDIYAPVCLQSDNGTYFASSHVRNIHRTPSSFSCHLCTTKVC